MRQRWTSTSTNTAERAPDNKVLYLSAGAVSVLQALHVSLPNPQKIAASALPDHRVLMLGDASDSITK
jgi:hypothetical protein